MATKRRNPGIVERHTRACASNHGRRCNCDSRYEAWISIKDGAGYTKVRRVFDRLSEAKAWRVDALAAQNRGRLPVPSKITVGDELMAWLEAARAGAIRNRSGKAYKPSSLRSYERAIRNRILPAEIAGRRVSDVRRMEVQDFADALLAEGLDGSTVANILNPLQAVFRRLVRREVVAVNPTLDIELPRSSASARADPLASAGGRLSARRSRPRSERSGRRPSTPAFVAASCERCASSTSTSPAASSTSCAPGMRSSTRSTRRATPAGARSRW